MNDLKIEWVDKYCPTKLDDYVLNENVKSFFKDMIKNKSLTSFTLCGTQGSGKTTLAKVICNELDADVLFVKCATEGVIDTLRTRVEPFCNAMSIEGKAKIVILDECDSAASSGTNSFQMALRTLIESAQSDTRFIITANYAERLIPAVLSRCPIIKIGFDRKELFVHIKKILDSENIKYDKDSLKIFLEESFKYYPDCRRIIKYLQICCSDGILKVQSDSIINESNNDAIAQLAETVLSTKNILDVRSYFLKNKDKYADYLDIANKMYSYVIDNNIVVSPDGILKLTDYLYYLNVCVDKESVFFGFMTAIFKFKHV